MFSHTYISRSKGCLLKVRRMLSCTSFFRLLALFQSSVQTGAKPDSKDVTMSDSPVPARSHERRATRSLLAIALVGASAGAACAAAAAPASAPVHKAVIKSMSGLKITATVSVGKIADWVAVTPDAVWIGSKGPKGKAPFALNEINPATNQVTTVALPGEPCAGIAADQGYLWVPLCGKQPGLAKVDAKSHTLTKVFDVGPAAPEGGIAAGGGGVWLITDKHGSLARIDPATGAVLKVTQVPAGSYNPKYSDGVVWVSRAEGAELTSVDAASGAVLKHFRTGLHPRFLTAGGGAVWTLDQGDGTVTQVDAAGISPVHKLRLHTPGPGGDITYADGRVWSTLMKTPLSVIDAKSGTLLCQWKGAGGDAVGVGHGAIWLTNYDVGTVSRIELSDVPAECLGANP